MPYKDRDKQNEYQRERLRKRRELFLSDKVCRICGSKDNLELDHIDRTLKVSHSVWSWSQGRRDLEIAKCQILCHNDHIDKTWSLDFKRAECGTHSKYTTGCRCLECKAAHAKCRREYLARKKASTLISE
jgi:hypothetical protein